MSELSKRDIPDAKTREALREAEERFEKAFRSNPTPAAITTTAEGKFVDANDAFLKMLGYTREQLIGRTSLDLNIWPDAEDRKRILSKILADGRIRGMQVKVRIGSGQLRTLEIGAERIEWDGVSCILTSGRDVTQDLKLERQLQQAQKMEAIGRLAAGVAHDFSNILGVIIGYAELTAERLEAGSPVAKNVSEIKRAADRAVALTRQLLAFSRQQVIYPRILDMNTMVTSVSRLLPQLLGEDITLTLKQQTPLGSVKADLGQMEQILMNLAANARDAMPEGGELTIETANSEVDAEYAAARGGNVFPGAYVMLSVSDNGCGMDPDTLAHIFEPFFTTKGPGLGTGIGLSTIYGIVEQNKGHIWVYSEPGIGTNFRILLPRVDQPQETFQPSAEEPALGGTEFVLCVEDDDALRGLIVGFLKKAGYKVLGAPHAEAAIEIAKRHDARIDLLLTDMIMPGMSGSELANHLLGKRSDLRVLFMSGYKGDQIARHAGSRGAISIVEKPFTKKALLTKVRATLDGRDAAFARLFNKSSGAEH